MGVRLENVSRLFGSFCAVDAVNLDIDDGEFFVLLGSSGSGKTTTLRMIAGLEVPSAGRIYINGREVTNLPPRERNIAMVFQDYGLYPHLSVFENIRFPLRIRGVSRIEHRRRVEDVASRLKIEHLLQKRPAQCSGGEKQRVALARALVRSPGLFLMDEPLSNLDAKLRLAMRGEIKQLVSELGITTVYVTHDQSEAMALASRVAVMSQGSLVQVGRPLDIYDVPANLFVAGFIGSPPMNFVAATVNGSGSVGTDDEALNQIAHESLPVLPAPLTGRRIMLGIRPEHLLVQNEQLVGHGAHIDLIEPMGQDTLLHVTVGHTPLIVTTRTRDFLPGQTVRLRPDPSKVIVIDQETSQTVFAQGEVYRGHKI